MKKEGGFTLVELLITIAILGVLAAIVVLNVGSWFAREPTNNEVPAYNVTLADELFSRPLSSLNVTELQFLADYCMWSSSGEFSYEAMTRWSTRATVYQIQLLLQRDACRGSGDE